MISPNCNIVWYHKSLTDARHTARGKKPNRVPPPARRTRKRDSLLVPDLWVDSQKDHPTTRDNTDS